MTLRLKKELIIIILETKSNFKIDPPDMILMAKVNTQLSFQLVTMREL
jgi:hypothetical protein